MYNNKIILEKRKQSKASARYKMGFGGNTHVFVTFYVTA